MDVDPDQGFFAGDFQSAIACPSCQQNSLCPNLVMLCAGCDTEILTVAFDLGDLLCLQDLHTNLAGLASKPLGKLGSGNALVESGKIVDCLRDSSLPAQ